VKLRFQELWGVEFLLRGPVNNLMTWPKDRDAVLGQDANVLSFNQRRLARGIWSTADWPLANAIAGVVGLIGLAQAVVFRFLWAELAKRCRIYMVNKSIKTF